MRYAPSTTTVAAPSSLTTLFCSPIPLPYNIINLDDGDDNIVISSDETPLSPLVGHDDSRRGLVPPSLVALSLFYMHEGRLQQATVEDLALVVA